MHNHTLRPKHLENRMLEGRLPTKEKEFVLHLNVGIRQLLGVLRMLS